MSAPTEVVARGLHRFFRRGGDEVAALRDVSLTVAAGETVAVMGPSGSGKSTLLHLLAGIDEPDGGTVVLAGQPMSHRPAAARAAVRARTVGVTMQGSGLVGHLSLWENLQLAAALRPGRVADTELSALLEAVALPHRARGPVTRLSGGETARANLAVALVGEPPVLLADEPTAEVSRDEEQHLLDLLGRLGAGRATVLVTHSDEVAARADRIVHLVDGRVQ